ncbi:protoporphyrinogen oxidase [Aeromicrobium phragmitis]|uniref:Coproporphyrinogen III oxidase n=1 Tax=Aeromicrobium phragmitis TaxID=2478914 RepID=A0A3L8PKK9_9ACTN|nr:protoporphyrinogen oxidase [Aeromicrobium phragmitis]RLV55319.1 protoporphyrinogen oxidase [Aeromicrobium phragmitis]
MRVAVVGGGIAGLTCAYDLQEAGADVVVFEGADRVGGKLLVGEVGGITVDLGAESMLARRPEALDLVAELDLGDRLVHPEPSPATLWTRGALRPMPPTVMGVPADLEALTASGVLSAPVDPRSVPVPEEDVSVGAFVAERVGRDVVDRLVEPLLGGVYAGHADRLSLRAAAPMIAALGPDPVAAAVQRRASGRALPGPLLAGLSGGVGTLPLALAERLEVRLNSTVRAMSRDGGGWTLVVGPTTQARRERFDAVVLAVPAPAASRLLAETAPRAAFTLAGIDYASMALVTFVLEGADLPSGSGFLVPPIDVAAIKAATFATNKWAWLAESAGDAAVVRTSLGRAGDTTALQRPDDELVATALADLRRAVEPVGEVGQVVARRVQRWGGGLPQYDVGHLDAVDAIEADVDPISGLALCGAAYHGVGIPAVIATAHAAAERILGQETMES